MSNPKEDHMNDDNNEDTGFQDQPAVTETPENVWPVEKEEAAEAERPTDPQVKDAV